jgi:hypothetical protein
MRLLPLFGIAFFLGYVPLMLTPPIVIALVLIPLSGVALPPC